MRPSAGRCTASTTRLVGALLLLVACGAPSAPPPLDTHRVAGKAFGTTWTVQWRGDDAVRPRVETAVVDALARVDARMSTWRDDSELSLVRASEGPVPVSAETAQVVRAALALAEATDGAFDPTVQPLMELWGFHGERRDALPSDEEVAAVRERVGFEKVDVSAVDGQWTVDSGGTALDLSAIAKGHGVDAVSRALAQLGLPDHYVEVGGEVRVHGRGPSGVGWRLGVDVPEAGSLPGQRFAAIVELTNAAMATSGNYRNVYEVDGQRVVHTMDPRLARPATSDAASVTVVAPTCRAADGWATALMVLGTDRGLALIDERPELEALVLQVSEGGFEQRVSRGMDVLLQGP